MKKRLRLPVGIENFEEIRRNQYYYIDKTNVNCNNKLDTFR